MGTHGDTRVARLNAIQQMMLQWSELYPYNACHVYRLAGSPDVGRLRTAIEESFAFNRVGVVELAEDGRHYTVEPCDTPEIDTIDANGTPEQTLTACVTAELNRPFPRPRCRPMRFSLIGHGPASHYLVTTYDHWTADSVASRLVLRHVLGSYLGLDIAENSRPLASYAGTYRDAFGRQLGLKRVAVAAMDSVRRCVFQPPAAQPAYVSVGNMAVDHRLLPTTAGTVARLRRYARSLDATVHDVLLAAMARAMASHLPRRLSRGRARDLALGTIVDTRPDAVGDVRESLGAFLAYHVVRLQPDETGSLETAVRRTAAFTRTVKANRSHLDSLAGIKLASAVWPYLKESTRPHFMRKVLPLTAGISNVVLRDDWLGGHTIDRILGYSRAASTGPSVPLVLSPTTLGEAMNIGLTYRLTAFPRAKIDGIQAMLLDQIESVGKATAVRRSCDPRPNSRRLPRSGVHHEHRVAA